MGGVCSFVSRHPPSIDLSFSLSSHVCYLTGSPPFILNAHLRNNGTKPVTLRVKGTALDVQRALYSNIFEFFEADTGKRMGMVIVDCETKVSRDHCPPLEDFVTLEPQTVHTINYVLADSRATAMDHEEMGLFEAGTTSGLEYGKTYTMGLTAEVFEIYWWAWGRKEKVMHRARKPAGYESPPPGFLLREPVPIVLRPVEKNGCSFRVE